MSWKIYITWAPGLYIPVQGSFKSEEDARQFYRRNASAFRRPDGSYREPVYIKQ